MSRIDYKLSCTLHVGERIMPCVVCNISLTGLLVEADNGDGISTGEKAKLVIEHFCPECTVSEIECEIVRQNGGFLGMKVSAIDYDTLMKIKDLLSLLTPDKRKIDEEILNMIANKKGE
jgi:hypothetical protein